MKVLMINGSPHAKGNTYLALQEMAGIFEEQGIETEILHIGNRPIRGCIACRSCLSSTFDELNKFFTISGMPIASSQYWNSVHGRELGEAAQDTEGMQIMRTLARNMTFLMKSIALGKEQFGLPQKEAFAPMNFIRQQGDGSYET